MCTLRSIRSDLEVRDGRLRLCVADFPSRWTKSWHYAEHISELTPLPIFNVSLHCVASWRPVNQLILEQHDMASASPPTKRPMSPTTPKPIDILQSQPAQLYASVHPVLLLSILLLSFNALVQDPVNSLLGLAPVVALLQAVYCILCLPYTGQAPTQAPKPGQKKKAVKPGQDFWARIVVCQPIIWCLRDYTNRFDSLPSSP